MTRPPKGMAPYSRTPTFNRETIPKKLLADHSTKIGVWGVIRVQSGELRYLVPADGIDMVLSRDVHGLIEPERLHRVQPLGDVSFYVEFWRSTNEG